MSRTVGYLIPLNQIPDWWIWYSYFDCEYRPVIHSDIRRCVLSQRHIMESDMAPTPPPDTDLRYPYVTMMLNEFGRSIGTPFQCNAQYYSSVLDYYGMQVMRIRPECRCNVHLSTCNDLIHFFSGRNDLVEFAGPAGILDLLDPLRVRLPVDHQLGQAMSLSRGPGVASH